MRIRKMKIQNLRAIDDLELDLTSPDDKPLDLAVLAGPNGCGKTSVLEACLWALKQDKLVPRKLPEQDYSIEMEAEQQGERISIVRDRDRHHVTNYAEGKPRQIIAAFSDLNTFFFSSWRAPKLVGSVGLTVGRGKRPAETQENSLWRLKQHLVNLKGASSFKYATGNVDEPFARLNELWKQFYPEREGRFEAEVRTDRELTSDRVREGHAGREDDLSFDLLYYDEKHPNGISVDDLSSGEIEILSMAGAFMLNKDGFDIVFIDEPELHLHVAWHRSVMRALRMLAPETQLICATHS
jgi:hypothetical protein